MGGRVRRNNGITQHCGIGAVRAFFNSESFDYFGLVMHKGKCACKVSSCGKANNRYTGGVYAVFLGILSDVKNTH